MKRRVIFRNKHGICKLPLELPNDLRLCRRKSRKYQENLKTISNINEVTEAILNF